MVYLAEERYYTVGEFARMLGMAKSTLRDLEAKGVIIPHHRSEKGYRYYSHEQYMQYCNRRVDK